MDQSQASGTLWARLNGESEREGERERERGGGGG